MSDEAGWECTCLSRVALLEWSWNSHMKHVRLVLKPTEADISIEITSFTQPVQYDVQWVYVSNRSGRVYKFRVLWKWRTPHHLKEAKSFVFQSRNYFLIPKKITSLVLQCPSNMYERILDLVRSGPAGQVHNVTITIKDCIEENHY